ncbi:transglycosylase family protein [Streptomyces sp. S399]|uniref:transglycosylase family protein n=1 Tax=Streptomyces sp. S399 TaxID=3096009 RepID=UPI0039C18CCE
MAPRNSVRERVRRVTGSTRTTGDPGCKSRAGSYGKRFHGTPVRAGVVARSAGARRGSRAPFGPRPGVARCRTCSPPSPPSSCSPPPSTARRPWCPGLPLGAPAVGVRRRLRAARPRPARRGAPGAPGCRSAPRPWGCVADCESGGRWDADTGNGYHGGLQFAAATRRSSAVPGTPRAPTGPPRRSRWPGASCGCGAGRHGRTARSGTGRPGAHRRTGGTLTSVAARFRVPGGAEALYRLNEATVGSGPARRRHGAALPPGSGPGRAEGAAGPEQGVWSGTGGSGGPPAGPPLGALDEAAHAGG